MHCKISIGMSQIPINSNFCHHTLVWWERMVRFQEEPHWCCTGSQDTAERHQSCRLCPEFPSLPFLTPQGEQFHGELHGHHGSYSHTCPFLWICQLKTCKRWACLCTGTMPVNTNAVEIRIQGNTNHRNVPYTPQLPSWSEEELQSSISSKENGWEFIEYRSMNVKILLFF